jgi:glycosyltransferase involved in cell wall biosynthesis
MPSPIESVVRPDLMVVGHSGFTAINRNVYVALAVLGWRLELVIPQYIPSQKSRQADPKRADDPPIHWVKVKGSNSRFWSFEGLQTVLKTRKPRAIYLEGDPASSLATTMARWARRNNVPLICYTIENMITPLFRSVFCADFRAATRTFRSLLMTGLTRSATARVFVLSDASVESMKVLGFSGRIFKMPLGYDPEIFRPNREAREKIRARHNLRAPVVAYIGRMIPGKGVEFLIEALEKLMDLEWHFLMDDFTSSVPGDYADRIQGQIAANPRLAARTQKFHADHYEVAAYMNAVDIVVAPSCLPEQYGRVLAEAMACGKIVIATNAGAYPELVRDYGIIVKQKDSEALAAALRPFLLDQSLGGILGAKASAMALRDLSIDAQVKIIDRHLNDILGSCGSATLPAKSEV